MEEHQQYETVDAFDRQVAGLLAGNNLHTKATTLQAVMLTKLETFIVQVIRVSGGDDEGDNVALQHISKRGTVRIVLPPVVVNAIVRGKDSLAKRARRNSSRASMRQRMAEGYVPTPPKRKRK